MWTVADGALAARVNAYTVGEYAAHVRQIVAQAFADAGVLVDAAGWEASATDISPVGDEYNVVLNAWARGRQHVVRVRTARDEEDLLYAIARAIARQ